jgi:putative oxidoreductase
MNATRYIPFAGRLLIGLPFAMSGLSKLAAIGPTTDMIRAAGLPLPPLALALSVTVEVGGGLLLVAGFQTRIVAAVLALFSLAFGAGALSVDNRGVKGIVQGVA